MSGWEWSATQRKTLIDCSGGLAARQSAVENGTEKLMGTNAIEGGDRHPPAQALFRPAMTTFDSLPPDILLEVFRELDAIDLIRVGMVSSSPLSVAFGAREFHFETEQMCKGVYDITQDREVWAVQTFVMGRAKLCRRFNEGDKNLCFTTNGRLLERDISSGARWGTTF